MIESLLEFYSMYEFISKFEPWQKFLSLSLNDFQDFKKNYKTSKKFIFGNKIYNRFKDIEEMDKKGELPDVFQKDFLYDIQEKVSEFENKYQGNKLSIIQEELRNIIFFNFSLISIPQIKN